MKVSRRWRRHAEVYRFFAENQCSGLDFSDEAARQAFEAESVGAKYDLTRNGYTVGKHWANVQVDLWRQDIGTLFSWDELLEAPGLAPIRWWVEEQCKRHLREKLDQLKLRLLREQSECIK